MKIVKQEFIAEGRKTLLRDIRLKTLDQHKDFIRCYPDSHYESMTDKEVEERLKELGELDRYQHLNCRDRKAQLKQLERMRHIFVWHDTSTVANHGYMVCLVSCLYDPAFYLTDEEYKAKTGKAINIQRVIEQPQLHIVARCSSSDVEQLAYSETRLQCITDLKRNLSTTEKVDVIDIMRFCNADSPARAFETGQQKGGHFFCSTCGTHADMIYNLDHVLNCPLVTIQDRQDAMLKGSIARRNTLKFKPKPLSGLQRKDLEEELASREVFEGKNKKELENLLAKEMKGKQRVPALLFNQPQAKLEDIGLDRYEVLPTEPLHDISHHIENFLTEIPHHLSSVHSNIVKDVVNSALQDKECKRGVDYRAAIIKVAGYAEQTGKFPPEVMQLMNSLVEMQRILYAPDKERTPALILRYYNQSWLHSILLKKLTNLNPKKLTLRKLFGVYFHDLTAHAGLMLRIICGQSVNAEKQERFFNHFKRITNTTSNYNPNQIIPNVFIRMQAERELGDQQDNTEKQQASISRIAECLNPPTNTHISVELVRKYSREWQAHLQQISDYLLEGQGVWWNLVQGDIVFNDISDSPSRQDHGPQLHHFRSSSLSSESSYLKECWSKCLEDKIPIPIHVIRTDLEDGTTCKYFTPYLGDPVSPQLMVPIQEVSSQPTVPELVPENDHEDDNDNYNNTETVIDMTPVDVEEINDINELTEDDAPMQTNSMLQNFLESGPSNQTQHTAETVPEPKQKQVVETTSPLGSEDPIHSKLGNALQVILGKTHEVIQFDKLHTAMKAKKNRDMHDQNLYAEKLAPIQTKVLAAKSKTERQLVEWEKEFTLKNNFTAPSYREIKNNPTAAILYKKIKFAKALLNEWKINF